MSRPKASRSYCVVEPSASVVATGMPVGSVSIRTVRPAASVIAVTAPMSLYR
ncbi:hypothetical protein QMK19_00470 [Streptomyces sp. H10-C2]|uniref:hypothetical protein n=1 Tax=unclassified Streptomyces TaxID=2593676 RepID=UPI0024BBD480|nr:MULTISPECIES: hypothetical protein [unclassified Streptomyces]MDJ0340357.1 hypothetical protein [Streptomyces sp. PH10-H1]MDJ0368195.1 hypothetical protein [Streptomyces sp. H10-C2]